MGCEFDMNCEYEKPGLGPQTTVVNDVGSTIVEVVGAVLAIHGIVGGIVSDPVMALIVTRAVGELGAGLAIAAVAWFMWGIKCTGAPEGTSICLSGIVDSLIPPATTSVSSAIPVDFLADAAGEIEKFPDQHSDVFPFMKDHPSFNLVVRCQDWNKASHNSGYNWSNTKDELYVVCYLEDPVLCSKLFLSAIGATVGGIGGIWAAIWADAAFLAICGAFFLCAILAIIVGAIAAAACAIFGAWAGNELGGPGESIGGEDVEQQTIRVGDYVAVRGNFCQISWLHNASALYFVEEWFWYGHEDAVLPPYDHKMAKDYFLNEDQEDKAYRFCKLGLKN